MSTISEPRTTDAGRRADWLALSVVLLLAALFFLCWFNRFAALRSGDGEYTGGLAFLAGRLPYRDYYTAGPPFNQIKSAIELGLFGKTLFVTRLCGVVERLLIAGVLFFWLRRYFTRIASALAALVTIIVSAGDRTDPLASYNHDAILFAILCGFFACYSMRASSVRRASLFAALAGSAAAISSLTKQTVGLGTAVAVLILLAASTWHLFALRRAVLVKLSYLAGFVLPIAVVALYLQHLGVLGSALHMLFVAGPKAKASGAHEFLTRELSVAIGNPIWVLLAVLALAVSLAAILRNLRAEPSAAPSASLRSFALAGFVVIAAACALALTSLPALEDFGKASVYFAFIGTSIVGLVAIALSFARRPLAARNWELALFAAVGWSVAFTLSLSWPAFEAMTLPGLALLLAAAHDGTRLWGRRFLYLVAAAMIFIQIREKLELPFAFNHQEEPAVRFATVRSNIPQLRGMRFPAETARLLDRTTEVMQQAAPKPEDTVFTYPEFGLIYALADRNPPTRAGSHNIDVIPDSFAREEAARLLAHPPKAILYARPTESDLLDDERIWRHGHRSGQRDLIYALDQLVSACTLTDTFVLKAGDTPIMLYNCAAKRP
ncbi:MAG: hypothetical protein PW792_08375 [Acidobacteriaceae bacterium]|nr:hypothetical protein [Acidobacteriaceae bacterium]